MQCDYQKTDFGNKDVFWSSYLLLNRYIYPSLSLAQFLSTITQCLFSIDMTWPADLTLCRAQHPKMSARGRGQNVPKRPVAIGKLHCFQTRKFPYNLARISWIITICDFRYFLPRHLHCLCVWSESERVFESRVEETRCWFSRRVSSTISDNDERFCGFRAEDIVLREAVADSDFIVNEVSSVHSSDWSKVALPTLLPVSKARSNARRRGRSLAFKTRWRMCFSGFSTSCSPSFVFMQTFSLFLLLTDKTRTAVKAIYLLIYKKKFSAVYIFPCTLNGNIP